MKNKINALLLLTVVGFSSCLKERPALDPEESNNVIEIYADVPTPTTSPADAVHPLYTISYNVQPSVDQPFEVNYAGAGTAPEDIVVTLELDPNALVSYNDEQGSHFTMMPANMYSVDSWTVTIPAGQKRATLDVEFFTDQFDLAESYGFPLKIASVSSGIISSNYGTVIYSVVAKNKYDGRYRVTGTCVDANGLYRGDYPRLVDLQTVNANTVQWYDYEWDHPNYIVVSIATGGGANTGIKPAFTFDDATGDVTRIYNIVNNTTLTMGPATTAYDNATRSFDSEWTLGRWHVTEHWEYVSERD
jgi:hypothetical protein